MTAPRKSDHKSISASEYVRTNFHPSDRIALLVRNSGTGETIQRIATAERVVGTSAQEWLRHKNEKEACDIYIGMNALKPEARTRTKEDIQTIRHLYLDIDQDGPAALEEIRQSNLVPTPNYTVNTSPDKFQLVWRVEGSQREEAEALLRAMARKFGGDPAATDSTRVLRLPGFLNKKYAADFLVRAEKHTDCVYHLSDFRLRTESIDNYFRPQSRLPSQRRDAHRPLSQSEHDWMYAKRALARGDDPEEIIRRIADFRSSEKGDPLYYARLTVTKAQGELTGSRQRMNSSANSPRLEPDTRMRTG
ncbi:MAG TPA: DNA-primase RepB domain-containing protein [Candidatus Acidoferrum sp.]|nr:DNA-primase RepB domain-containing protein [Candidatus Acidoferrum sp.]